MVAAQQRILRARRPSSPVARSGIGEACVQRLAAEGGRILLVDINEQGARDVAEGHGGRVLVVADICEDGVAAMVVAPSTPSGRSTSWSTTRWSTEIGPLLAHTPAGWQRTFDSSVTAVWRSACQAVPVMIAHGGGAFVNISSNAALAAIPGLGAYGAAKAGVIQITRQIAAEFGAAGIRATLLLPA